MTKLFNVMGKLEIHLKNVVRHQVKNSKIKLHKVKPENYATVFLKKAIRANIIQYFI